MTFTNKKNIDSGNKIDITVMYLKLTFPMNVPKDKIKRTLEITNPKYWNNIEYKNKQNIVVKGIPNIYPSFVGDQKYMRNQLGITKNENL